MVFRGMVWIVAASLGLSACASTGGALRPSPFPSPAAPPAIYPEPLSAHVNAFSTASLISAARRFAGVRYRTGGESPESGFDCSGYVRYVFGLFHVAVPRTVQEQYHAGRPNKGKAIHPGDLLFFRISGSQVSHVALAIGPDEFIHAPGDAGAVRTEKLSSPYWRARFVGARRII